MNSKSKVYGYYGGVRKENHYVPAPSSPFVPYPPSVVFYQAQSDALEPFTGIQNSTVDFLSAERPYLLRRYLEDRIDDVEEYKINTEINPEDILTYSTGLSGPEDLSKIDGGLF
jgi:hypothetical protein